jgi:Mg/Co/Ni transporter MgtE
MIFERMKMPQQEKFFEQTAGDRRVEVLKTYDRQYAREVFGNMDESAHTYLWSSLGIDDTYDASDIPPRHNSAGEDFLWEELLEAAREDGNLLSFFVVNEAKGGGSESLYVSPDWPSAEAFAKTRIAAS